MPPHPCRARPRQLMINPLAGYLGGAPYQVFRRLDRPRRQGRAAAQQAAAAAGRRAQHRRHDLGLGQREAIPARPDRLGPPQSDRQRQRAALRLARIRDRQHADPRSQDAHGHELQGAGARSETCRNRSARACRGRASRSRRRPTGARRRSGTPGPTTTTPCSTGKGRVWLAATMRGPDNPDFCKKGSDHPSAKVFPLETIVAPGGDARSQDDEVHLRRHLLRHRITRSSATTPTTRCGLSGAGAGRRLGQHQDVRRDRRRREGAGLVAVRPRHQRQRQARRVRRAQPADRSRQGQAHHPAAPAPMR